MKTHQIIISGFVLMAGLNSVSQTPIKQANTLTIYSYPPAAMLDWTSPQSSLASFANITIWKFLTDKDKVQTVNEMGQPSEISRHYKSTMGHAISHISCDLPDGNRFDKWASLSGQNFEEVDKKNLLKDKIGLGVMFFNYEDGHIIEGEENRLRLIYYEAHRDLNRLTTKMPAKPRFMQVHITAEECLRLKVMENFFESFNYPANSSLEQLQARPPEKKMFFSSTIDPYQAYHRRQANQQEMIGGGCAPFAVSLLKESGHHEDYFDRHWKLSLTISNKLIGGVFNPQEPSHQVPVKDLFFGPTGWSWTHEGWQNQRLSIYDPEKIWQFIGEALQCIKQDTLCPQEVADWIQSKGTVSSADDQILSHTRKIPSPDYDGDAFNSGKEVNETKTVTIEGIILN